MISLLSMGLAGVLHQGQLKNPGRPNHAVDGQWLLFFSCAINPQSVERSTDYVELNRSV